MSEPTFFEQVAEVRAIVDAANEQVPDGGNMTHLHVLMEIDTCPMCGNAVRVTDNGFVGNRFINEIPPETVFEIACSDATGTTLTCGKFVIKRRDQMLYDNDWVAEYIPVYRNW